MSIKGQGRTIPGKIMKRSFRTSPDTISMLTRRDDATTAYRICPSELTVEKMMGVSEADSFDRSCFKTCKFRIFESPKPQSTELRYETPRLTQIHRQQMCEGGCFTANWGIPAWLAAESPQFLEYLFYHIWRHSTGFGTGHETQLLSYGTCNLALGNSILRRFGALKEIIDID